MINNLLPIVLGILGLLSAYFVYLKVKSSPKVMVKLKKLVMKFILVLWYLCQVNTKG